MKKAIVIGGGAGGCMAAKELSEGYDVTLLEAGKQFEPFSYKLSTFEPMRRAGLFLDEKMIQLLFEPMRIVKARQGLVHVNGRGIGGTTTLATGNAVRDDRFLQAIGIDLSEEFLELENEIPITRDHYANWSDQTVRLYMAFEDLGYDPMVTPKFMADVNKCTACGHCVLGCRFGAKWTADRLLDGQNRVQTRINCTVTSLIVENGEVRGVEVQEKGRGRYQLEADLVILAAGGLATPLILEASGIPTKPTLFVDPVICVAAPWKGSRLDAQLPMPFVAQRNEYILSPYFDWLSFFFNEHWRMPAHDIVSIMIKYEDSCEGSFDGRRLDKPVTSHDSEVINRSVEEARLVLEEVGIARKDMFLGTLNAGHPGGCLPLTEADAATLHPDVLPGNLYVADASLFPHSMGNPPILAIMALAKRIARLAADAV